MFKVLIISILAIFNLSTFAMASLMYIPFEDFKNTVDMIPKVPQALSEATQSPTGDCVDTRTKKRVSKFERGLGNKLDEEEFEFLNDVLPPKKIVKADPAKEVAVGENPKNYDETLALNLDIMEKDFQGALFLKKAPKDIKTFCPKYEKLDNKGKRKFWAHLVTSMAKYESNFKSATVYDESRTSKSLKGVVSKGMLQLSIGSATQAAYVKRGCPIRKEHPKDLFIPRKNLACGFAIIDQLTHRDGCISCSEKKGAAAYWSVLREPYPIKDSKTGKTIMGGKKAQVIATIKKKYPSCN